MYKTRQPYEALVPDTLDLGERAKLAINALVGFNRGLPYHQPNHCANFYRNPPVMSIDQEGGTYCNPHNTYIVAHGEEMWGKYLEALVEMRVASGSDQEIDMDEKTFAGMMSCMEEDNLLWTYAQKIIIESETLGEKVDFVSLGNGGCALVALAAKYELTKDPVVKKQIEQLTKGYIDLAYYKEDYAYYPDGHLGGGVSMPRGGYTHDKEPAGYSMHDDMVYFDTGPAVEHTFGSIVRGLCRSYRITGDEKTLDLAGRLVRFMMKERFWKPQCDPDCVVSADHAHFEGHIHAVLRGLLGLIDYGVIAEDEQVKAFVRDGYEYIRTFGIARIGLFGETCSSGDITCLAVKLSDAGVGDYWEDADQYVRNHLTEVQILDEKIMRDICAQTPETPVKDWDDAENFFARNLGSLCDDAVHPTSATMGLIFCCAINGYIGFYYAWDGIVRCDDGAAQINLLLNRASEWLDIDSYEPYEGRAVIRNKTAKQISVRIPRFADFNKVNATINGQKVEKCFVGRYLLLKDTAPGDVIEITYPLPESTASYTHGWPGIHLPGWTESSRPNVRDEESSEFQLGPTSTYLKGSERVRYTCRFKGNTLIDISPREDHKLGYPLYKREHFKQNTAPMKTVTRTIPEKVIDWRIR